MKEELYTVAEIAGIYDVTPQSVYRWIKRYNVETVTADGKRHITAEGRKTLEAEINPIGPEPSRIDEEAVQYQVDIARLEERNKALKERIETLELETERKEYQIGELIHITRLQAEQIQALEAPAPEDEKAKQTLWNRFKAWFK